MSGAQFNPFQLNLGGILPRGNDPPPGNNNGTNRNTTPVVEDSTSNDDGARRVLFPSKSTASTRSANRSERLRTLEQRIKQVFERRWPGFEYRFIRVLRAGAAGQTWLLRYKSGDFADGGWSRMVLKTPQQNATVGRSGKTDPMKDILRTPGSSGWEGPRKGDDWLYLEYLEHGTLLQFVDACIEVQLYQIPNRMAWRFFLCLIRACIGMAYPPTMRLGGNIWESIPPNTQPELHIHGDMHSGNGQSSSLLLLAHAIQRQANDGYNTRSEGPGRNIFDIACLMVELIFMIPDGASKVFQCGPKQIPAVPLGAPLLQQPAGQRPNFRMIESYAEFLHLNPYQSAHFNPGGMLGKHFSPLSLPSPRLTMLRLFFA
ncbi:hypothetical protein PG993_000132 [Apiospora rasikravindrae]|uniref:Protein kinase domain-containing protein n=1 Tax=Apiospora rasikravindrae TaxID=990691 RepID=A0ABR1U9X9_9PEZI